MARRVKKRRRSRAKEQMVKGCCFLEHSKFCRLEAGHAGEHKMKLFNRCGGIENNRQCRLDADWHAHQACYFGEEPTAHEQLIHGIEGQLFGMTRAKQKPADIEIHTLKLVTRKLLKLGEDERYRVVGYLEARFGAAVRE